MIRRFAALAITGLAVVLAAVTMTSCEIQHRSGDFTCTRNIDCPSGRTCHDGFCIVAGSIDAGRADGPRADAGSNNNNCPEPCTSCNSAQKSCTIDCTQAGDACDSEIACPAGYTCEIACNTQNACRKGIDCTSAASCDITCSGRQSCEDVECGPGPCEVACTGPGACRDVSCGSSCACDVRCTGVQSCQDNIRCSSFACRAGNGCTSNPQVCHSCE